MANVLFQVNGDDTEVTSSLLSVSLNVRARGDENDVGKAVISRPLGYGDPGIRVRVGVGCHDTGENDDASKGRRIATLSGR